MAFRAFISIDLQPNEKIVRFSNDLRALGRGLKVVDPSSLHITLKFLGDTGESIVPQIVSLMESATSDTSPFPIHLNKAGTFGNKSKIRTVWIGISDDGYLSRIAGRLDEELSTAGFERERRPFSPHLTIARARENSDSRKIKELVEEYEDVDFGTQQAEFVRLKKSELRPEGPIYSIVEEIRLQE